MKNSTFGYTIDMNKLMKKERILILIILIFSIISILSIKSASLLLGSNYFSLHLKQIIWYVLGFLLFIFVYFEKKNIFIKYSTFMYIISVVLLIFVLLSGKDINNSKGWFFLGNISFQPSEFMKLSLILMLSKVIFKNRSGSEFLLIIKCLFYTLIPISLVFLQPDTGSILVYLAILFSMLLVSGINKNWFILFFILLIIMIFSFMYLYIFNQGILIDIFGESLFYRFHRLIDWQNKEGYQLSASLISIGSAYLFGNGFLNPGVYIPECYTDFIFSVLISCTGLIGGLILIILYLIFFLIIYKISINARYQNKLIIIGCLSVFLTNFIINIGMTIGLLPITGIPLTFISYGGSNLIVSFIILGIILKINKKSTFVLNYINNPHSLKKL